jgi:hypothetical protein
VSAPLDWLPEAAKLPDHAPEATQELASVDDHVRVEDPLLVTELGLAASDTVGVGGGVEPDEPEAVTGSVAPPQAASARTGRARRSVRIRKAVNP